MSNTGSRLRVHGVELSLERLGMEMDEDAPTVTEEVPPSPVRDREAPRSESSL